MLKKNKQEKNWKKQEQITNCIPNYMERKSKGFLFSFYICTMNWSTTLSLISFLFCMHLLSAQVEIRDAFAAQFSTEIHEVYASYPELQNNRVIFKSANISSSLNARPTILSLLFRRRSKRTYVIRINASKKDSIVTLDEVPQQAVVGVIGHEFCHVLDYHTKSFWGVLGRGFAYMTRKVKGNFEKEIDSIAISRGFGEGLYLWSDHVLNHSDASARYKEYKRAVYYRPEEIRELIELHNTH